MEKDNKKRHKNNATRSDNNTELNGAALSQRVPWSDAEMEVLLNWLTTQGNYSYYRGNEAGKVDKTATAGPRAWP